ncbi:MAG: Heimdall-CTERM domain-containing surface protein, partial [Promethearchaeota archaeon]
DLNTGMDWMIPCWFEVSDEVTGFTIWIDPEGGIQLGQETKFEFGVINNQFDVFEGKVELLLYHPDDTRETLLSDEIQLIKNVEYVNSISIAFNEPGKYLVVLYVEDLQSDESWTEKYDITLYEGSTDITETKTDTETEPKTQDTSEESVTPPAVIPGFESLFALVALCILIPVIKRKRN